MWISRIIGKEIGEEFLGMEHTPNGFPLPAGAELLPSGSNAGAVGCAEQLCSSKKTDPRRLQLNWKLMKLLDPSRSGRGSWVMRQGSPARAAATQPPSPLILQHQPGQSPRHCCQSTAQRNSPGQDGHHLLESLGGDMGAPGTAWGWALCCPVLQLPQPEVGTWQVHKAEIPSSEMAVFQTAIISVL